MSYWYRPNVFKRRWGSYGGIKNNYFNDYDPDNGDDNYIESDDVDINPDIYTTDTFYDPDNDIERADRPDLDNDEDFSKTSDSVIEDLDVYPHAQQVDTFDDPDAEEFEKAGLLNDKTDSEEYEQVQEEPIEANELPIQMIADPNNPEHIYTYDENTLKILEDMKVNINNDDQLIEALQVIQNDIRENNYNNLQKLIKEEGIDNTIPVIEEKGDEITVKNIDYEQVPHNEEIIDTLETTTSIPMEEIKDFEFHKDNADPDKNIIPPRPPRERRTLKEWVDKSRDSAKRKHHLEDNEYKTKRNYEDEEIVERQIAIEETKKEIDNNKEEVKEEIRETQPEQRVTQEVEVEEEVDNWRDQDKIFNELKNQTSQFNKKESNHKNINTNHIQEKVEELKKAIDETSTDQGLKELNRLKQELAKIKKSIDANHKLPLLMSKPSTTSKIDHGDQKDPNYSKGIDKLVEQEEEDLRTSNIQETSLDTLTLSDQQKYWNNFKHNDGIEGGNDADVSNEVDLEGEEEEIEQEEEPEIEYEYEYEYEY